MARTPTTKIGDKFGKLTVTNIYREPRKNKTSFKYLAECLCECGNTWVLEKGNLHRNKDTKQCGFCNNREVYAAANGNSTKKEHNELEYKSYYTWKAIQSRCYNKKDARYERYGERGIEVCFSWLEGYDNFLKDMGFPDNMDMQIERKNNDGNYEPLNCFWATRKQQANNKSNNHKITAFGQTKNLQEWADELGIKRETIAMRIKRGYTHEQSLSKEKISKKVYANPKGEFNTLKEAGEAFGLKISATHSRFNSDNFPEWQITNTFKKLQ